MVLLWLDFVFPFALCDQPRQFLLPEFAASLMVLKRLWADAYLLRFYSSVTGQDETSPRTRSNSPLRLTGCAWGWRRLAYKHGEAFKRASALCFDKSMNG